MKFDMHIHTRYSGDSLISPEKAVRVAKEKGLDGIAVTDHNTTAAWKEAAAEAKKEGILLIKGEEVKVKVNGKTIGEIMGYFLKRPIKSRDPLEVIQEIRKQGGLVIIPHPFDGMRRFKDLGLVMDRVDGLEGFNSRATRESNKQAFELAKHRKMMVTGGSDAHAGMEIGNGWTEAEASSIEEFRKAVESGKARIGGDVIGGWISLFSTVAKLQRLKK